MYKSTYNNEINAKDNEVILSSVELAGWVWSYNSDLRNLCKAYTCFMPQFSSTVKWGNQTTQSPTIHEVEGCMHVLKTLKMGGVTP